MSKLSRKCRVPLDNSKYSTLSQVDLGNTFFYSFTKLLDVSTSFSDIVEKTYTHIYVFLLTFYAK
jgi:hypothetical protein